MTLRQVTALAAIALLGLVPFTAGCKKKTPAGAKPDGSAGAAPSSSAPRPASSDPAAAERAAQMRAAINKVVNPKNEEPYKGPAGTVRGVVRIEGDPPPPSGLAIPSKCTEGAVTHGKLFRVGQDHSLGDVLVAVTDYTGFVPAKAPAVKVTIHGCALSRRTIAMAFGQRLEVANLDQVESYMPYLDGAPSRVVMVAPPSGEPVKLYAPEPGHYLLRDQLPNPHMFADVFVLAYATHDTTGLDGQYEIKGVPVGKAKLNAFLPSINKVIEKVIDVREGTNTFDLTMSFDAKKDLAPAGSASAGAAPSAAPAVPPATPSATPDAPK